MDEWQTLNQRQQAYLKEIYMQDQAQERAEKSRAAREWNSRPADEWRWILYANTLYDRTPLKQAIKDAGMVDPGTGSTFEALEKRGYILTRSVGATEHHRSELMVYIRLTTKGRKLARQVLDIHAPARLPVGMLREWHWRALCRAYACGDDGFHSNNDMQDGFGYVSWKTCLRLRDYTIKGKEKRLINEKKYPCAPRRIAEGYTQDFEIRLCITDFGRQYYRENWQWYRNLYPAVDAPDPFRN